MCRDIGNMFLYYESLVLMNSFYHKLPDQFYLPLIPICFQLAPNAFLRQVIFLPASFNMLLMFFGKIKSSRRQKQWSEIGNFFSWSDEIAVSVSDSGDHFVEVTSMH